MVANGGMQNPVGSAFSYETMRMEMTSFAEVLFNPVAQVKFVHTVSAGYVTASMFVLGISSWYMLKGRDIAFARRSFAIAAAFGLASVLSVIVLGDESGYEAGDVQKVKLAAIEAEWDTHEPPAAFTLFGLPNQEKMETEAAVRIPWVMGLIATRSTDEEVLGIKDILKQNKQRVHSGIEAYRYLTELRRGDKSPETIAAFERYKDDLGYGLLLKAYVENPADATPEQIAMAVNDTIPPVAPLFFTFRIMVAAGFWMLLLIGLAFYYTARRKCGEKRWLLRALLFSIPVPWIASEMGWFVAEFGRQPWAIGEVLPTVIATSSRDASDVMMSLGGFIGFYTFLLVIEMYLMFKFARLGPSSLHTGRYHHEQPGGGDPALASQPAASLKD